MIGICSSESIDPYESLALDFDTPPQPVRDYDYLRGRSIPDGSWSAFAPTRFDHEDLQTTSFGDFYGRRAVVTGPLSSRLDHLSIWFHRVAHQPIALWWAATRGPLHPNIVAMVEAWLRQEPDRFPKGIYRGWRLLIASWDNIQGEPDLSFYKLSERISREGWSESRVREYAAHFTPRLKVEPAIGASHPLVWTDDGPNPLLSYDVEYPHPYELLSVPGDQLAYAVARFRENLDLARSLEAEISGHDFVHLETTRPDDGAEPIAHDSYGVTGLVSMFLQLMEKLVKFAPPPRSGRNRFLAC